MVVSSARNLLGEQGLGGHEKFRRFVKGSECAIGVRGSRSGGEGFGRMAGYESRHQGGKWKQGGEGRGGASGTKRGHERPAKLERHQERLGLPW